MNTSAPLINFVDYFFLAKPLLGVTYVHQCVSLLYCFYSQVKQIRKRKNLSSALDSALAEGAFFFIYILWFKFYQV